MKFEKCRRCETEGLERLETHTICHNCNWSPDLSVHSKRRQGLDYYFPLNTDLVKQIKEILILLEGHYPKIA